MIPRALPVDDHLWLGVEGMWAIGDDTGKGAFTHMSMYQADIVVGDVLGHDVVPADYPAVPRVTFTHPEIGSVGLSERAARERGLEVRVRPSQIPGPAVGSIHEAGNQGSSSWSRTPAGGPGRQRAADRVGGGGARTAHAWPSMPRSDLHGSGT